MRYFWVVANEGSIARASEKLHLTPQTISVQITTLENQLGTELFMRSGRGLELTETGKRVLSYADEIFSLGGELEALIHQLPASLPQTLKIGVVDVVPKSITHRILSPALRETGPIRLVCREADLDSLLAELAVHRLDLVLADRPIPATVSTRGYSHRIGECGVSFFAADRIKAMLKPAFPACLEGAPILLPSTGNHLRSGIDQWLAKHRLYPKIIAEFDDSALMKVFGQEGAGIFIAPTAIEAEVASQFQCRCIGRIDEVKARFYAISVERRIVHPVVVSIIATARESLFARD